MIQSFSDILLQKKYTQAASLLLKENLPYFPDAKSIAQLLNNLLNHEEYTLGIKVVRKAIGKY